MMFRGVNICRVSSSGPGTVWSGINIWDFLQLQLYPCVTLGQSYILQGLGFLIYKMRFPRSCLSPSLNPVALALPGKMPAWPLFSGESFVS